MLNPPDESMGDNSQDNGTPKEVDAKVEISNLPDEYPPL